MTEPTLKEKTAKGIFWGGFNTFGQQIIQLCFGVFMARILSPDDYGLVAMLGIFTIVAGLIQESGFSTALINKQSPTQEDYSSVFWFNVLISLIIYMILFGFAGSIAVFFDKPILVPLSKVVFLSFVFNALAIVQNAILTKELAIRKLSIVNLVSIILSCSVGLTMALLGMMYWAIAVQTVSMSAFRAILLWGMSKWRPSFLFSMDSIKDMSSFSLKLLLTSLVNQVAQNLYSILLGKYYNEKQVGYYAQGYKQYNTPFSMVYGIINTIAFPVLATVKDEHERQRQVFRKMVRFTAFISFPFILGFGFVANELILLLITDKWIESIPIIQLLCIWGAFLPIHCLYANVIVSRGLVGIGLILNLVYGLLLIISLIASTRYGIIVMLEVNLVINFLFLLSHILVTKKWMAFSIRDFCKDVFPFLGITVGVFLIVYLLSLWIENMPALLAFKVIVSILLYLAVHKWANSVIFNESVSYFKEKLF